MLLLIDGNNLAWAGFYALERVMKPEDEERRGRVALLGLAAGVLGSIARGGEAPVQPGQPVRDAAAPLTRVVVCFDEGRPLRRRKIYPPYQTGREQDPKFIANEPTILGAIDEFSRDALRRLPVEVLRGKNTEADDLIAGTVHANPRVQKRIVSTDRDFLQLIDAKTSVYAPVKKIVIDDSNFDEAVAVKGANCSVPRDRFLDYRTLAGDPSDNLPGVPGIGAVTAARLAAAAPLATYFADPSAVRAALGRKMERVEQAFADGTAREIADRNRTLMDLRLPAPCWDELDALTTRGTWDQPAFDAWWEEQRMSAVDRPALMTQIERLASGAGKRG